MHIRPTLRHVAVLALCLGLGIGHATAADTAPKKVAETKTEHDAANIGIVKAFVEAWSDPAKAAESLSDKAVVRMEEDKPAAIGRQPFIDAWKGYFQGGAGISVKILEYFVRGPVVVTHRIDTLSTKGKPDQPFDVVGVFVVKDGKIVEWTDYLNK